MDCTQAQDRILDELDGLREAPGRQELQQHLAECEPCRSFAALQRRLDAELRESTPVLAPGSGFGKAGEGYVRVALCDSERRLGEAGARMAKAGLRY